MDAEAGGELAEDDEIGILRPDREVVCERGRGDDRVHRTGSPARGPRAREDLGEMLGDALVEGERDEPAGLGERPLGRVRRSPGGARRTPTPSSVSVATEMRASPSGG